MKIETKVYLPIELSRALDQLASRTRRPKSEIVRAAVAAFLSPDGTERHEAAFQRRLDRLSQQVERTHRDSQVILEALGIFIRAWMAATPRLAEQDRAAAQALGQERYGEFVERLCRRLADNRSLLDLVLSEVRAEHRRETAGDEPAGRKG